MPLTIGSRSARIHSGAVATQSQGAAERIGLTSMQRHYRLDPAIHLYAKKMDPWVKPTGDEQIPT